MKRYLGVLVGLIGMAVGFALPVGAQPTATNAVSYNGFSFSYDRSLSGHLLISEFGGDDPALEQPGGPEVKHVQFTVSEADTQPSIFDSAVGIRVYNTADFTPYPNQPGQIQLLQTLLTNKPDLNAYMNSTDTTGANNLPFLPIMPAAQVIRARAQYVVTPSVSGISYITLYKQDVSPFLSGDFFYTFQGVSADGAHYVAAVFKLNTALFPATYPSDFNMDTFNTGYMTYVAQSVATLNSAQPTDFTPALATLDAVIQSFAFAPTVVSAMPTQAPTTSSDSTFGGLTQAEWTLVSYGSPEAPIAVLPSAPINLLFTTGGVSGSAGCNTYFGQFHYDIQALSFSGIGNTLMICTDSSVMTQESDYLDALRSATTFGIENGVLKITYADGVLVFNASNPPVEATPTPVVGGNASLGGLAGVNWVLTSYGPTSAPVAVLPDTALTAQFTSNGVSGNGGCNTYSGNFQYDNGVLTFTPLVMTKMACADAGVMTQETAFVTALQSASSYQIVNGQLEIAYADGVLVFKADAPAVPTAPITNSDSSLGGLAGVHWVLVSYGPAAAPVTALPDAPIDIDFTPQGVSGNAGCNQYSGTFIYDNFALTFSPLVATEKACVDVVMVQESAYLTALQHATDYQVTAGLLQINYPDGVLVFKAVG